MCKSCREQIGHRLNGVEHRATNVTPPVVDSTHYGIYRTSEQWSVRCATITVISPGKSESLNFCGSKEAPGGDTTAMLPLLEG